MLECATQTTEMTSESAVQPPLEKCPCCFPPVMGRGGQSGVAVASSCPRQFLEEWAAEGRQEWWGKQVKAFLESALTKAFEIQWVLLLLLFSTAACLLCCFQCLHWPWREETRGKLERERELEYLPPNQSFISFLNDCMFIALPEAQYKVFWTSDELIKLNAVTPLLSGSVTSLPAPCLISASNSVQQSNSSSFATWLLPAIYLHSFWPMPECLVWSFYLDHCWFMELCRFHVGCAADSRQTQLASAGLLALKGNKESRPDSLLILT